MKRKISFLLVAVLLLATLIPALSLFAEVEEVIQSTFNPDDANPTISTKEDYIAFFKAAFAEGKKFKKGKTVTLLHDITFNDTTVENWWAQDGVTKLVCSNSVTNWNDFSATFDGNGHTLTGVIVEGAGSADSAGLFPHAGYGAVIKNLTVDGFYVCGTNTTREPNHGAAGIGSLIGVSADDVTVDHCTLKNGVVTGATGVKSSLGGIIGAYYAGGQKSVNITDSVVSDVRVLKGGCVYDLMGGIFGCVDATPASNGLTLDLSGSVLQPTTTDGIVLGPVGSGRLQGRNNVAWKVRNSANGYFPKNATWIQFIYAEEHKKNYFNSTDTYIDCTDACNDVIEATGCYGADAVATVQLVGVQPATNGSNDLRFVGLIKKVDLSLITDLGFELTVGDKTIGTDKIQCTKVYNSILAAGETLTAPEGYYYFTFVVTGVEDGTALNINASATVAGKLCTTTTGSYTYTRAAS